MIMLNSTSTPATSAQDHLLKHTDIVCLHIVLSGFVQGVGFRPFVLRLANELALKGYVANNVGQVSIFVEGDNKTLELFLELLIKQAPLNAKPEIISVSKHEILNFEKFSIQLSDELSQQDIHILPDLPVCEQCLDELFDKNNRRYLYPFINCTQCGPRNSIILSLPYDRKNTSMRSFPLCDECRQEYLFTENRRFHAEPIACETCGPVLNYVDENNNITGNQLSLEACVDSLKQGQIVAVKGIGGYHLMCDATSSAAITSLRLRKHRPDKPFAVLLDQSNLNDYVDVTDQELSLLLQNSRPIVLLKFNSRSKLAENIAPGLNRLGVMLPSNPLQHLICDLFKKPMIATSANVSSEPIITDNFEATKRLNNLADAFLHNNRDIVRPADDPVMLHNHVNTQILRTGRGLTPTEYKLPFFLKKPVLALGGHIKNTIALAWQNRMIISAHNGDLGNLRSYQVFQKAITDLQQLYQVQAEQLVCDAHPEYAGSQWALASGLPVVKIFHHHAHASSVYLDALKNKSILKNAEESNWLIFSWDGVGLGEDGSLWGGETFLGEPGRWKRVASFKSFKLPGGDKTAREAWRMAASLCWQTDIDCKNKKRELEQLKIVWDKNINCPTSSAAGRLFSAAASLLGLLDVESFEGHGPMLLEALAEKYQQGISPVDMTSLALTHKGNILSIDWQPLILMLKNEALSKSYRARCFHEIIAETILTISLKYAEINKNLITGFSGGVFQNQLLLRLISQRFEKNNLKYIIPSDVPVNDAGLCVGQIVEYYSALSIDEGYGK